MRFQPHMCKDPQLRHFVIDANARLFDGTTRTGGTYLDLWSEVEVVPDCHLDPPCRGLIERSDRTTGMTDGRGFLRDRILLGPIDRPETDACDTYLFTVGTDHGDLGTSDDARIVVCDQARPGWPPPPRPKP